MKIKYLQQLGVGGVEGVGHPVCMTTICAFLGVKEVREVKEVKPNVFRRSSAEKGNRFSWICNPAGVSIRICNPIIEFLFLTFAAEKSLQKLYIYLIELQILILHAAGLQIRLNRGEFREIVWEF